MAIATNIKGFYKRKLPRLPPVITVLKKEWVEGNGGGNGDDNKGKGPNY